MMNHSTVSNSYWTILLPLALLLPSSVYAHNFGLIFEWLGLFVIASFTAIHLVLVLLLRWKKYFRHLWLMLMSSLLSLVNLNIAMLAFFDMFDKYLDPRYLADMKGEFIFLFIVLSLNALAIIWLFSLPLKQYNTLSVGDLVKQI